MGESILRDREIPFQRGMDEKVYARYRKGIRLIFLNQDVDWEVLSKTSFRKAATQVNSENGGKSPGKRFLFFLTLTKQADPGIRLTGDRVCWAEKQHDFLCCPVHC